MVGLLVGFVGSAADGWLAHSLEVVWGYDWHDSGTHPSLPVIILLNILTHGGLDGWMTVLLGCGGSMVRVDAWMPCVRERMSGPPQPSVLPGAFLDTASNG